jgi:predicted nucleic acid-binding protein
MSVVLDASQTIAWLFEDEADDAAMMLLRKVGAEGAMVPGLWRLEIANVLRNAAIRGRCDDDYVDESLSRLARLPIECDDETDSHAWTGTLALAREEHLTLYDAAYLELALRKGLPLASRDKELVSAAKRRGLEVVGAVA